MATQEDLQKLLNAESFAIVNPLLKVMLGLQAKLENFTPLAEGAEISPRGSEEEKANYSATEFFNSSGMSPILDELGLSFKDLISDTPEGEAARQTLLGGVQDKAVEAAGPDLKRLAESTASAQEDINKIFTDLANKTDFSSLSPEQAEKELAILKDSPEIQSRLDRVQKQIDFLGSIGEDVSGFTDQLGEVSTRVNGTGADLAGTQFVPEGAVVDARGNIISQADADSATDFGTGQAGASGRAASSVRMEEQPDGTWSVISNDTNEVLASGLADAAAANAKATELQSGATPDATGAFGGTGDVSSSILDEAGINYTGLTQEQVTDLEAIHENAGNSSLVNDALSSSDVFDITNVTDDAMLAFMDEAREFVSGKGSAFEQSFTRAKEDFQFTLDFQAKEREVQLEQEKLSKLIAQEQSAAQSGEGGTAFSGLQRKAEKRLEDRATQIAESSRRAFASNIRSFTRGTEDIVGSEALSGANIPTIGGEAITGLTPGGIKGSLEREQETAVQLKAGELQKQRLEADQKILEGESALNI